MQYSIEILRNADKALRKLAKGQPSDADAIEAAIESLGSEPRPPGCSALKGYTGILRIRVGSYRICYRIDDGRLLILVITISTRDDVYDILRRHLGN